MEILVGIGVLTIFYFIIKFLFLWSKDEDRVNAEYERLIKEANLENHFYCFCVNHPEINIRTPRSKALKMYFTKDMVKQALNIIAEKKKLGNKS